MKITNEIAEYVKVNYPLYGKKHIMERFGVSYNVATKWVHSLKVKVSRNTLGRILSEAARKPHDSHKVKASQFLDIQTREVAYILGYIWADGSIKCKHGYGIGLDIADEDFQDIEATMDRIGEWGKYLIAPPQHSPHWKPKRQVKTSNRAIYELLESCDYASKHASPCKILARIPEHLRHYWWRGYFDGDGCLYLNDKSSSKQLMMYSEFDQDWAFARKLFEQLGANYTVLQKITKGNRKSSCFRTTNYESCKAFCDYIYQGYSEDGGMGLQRKHDKYLLLLQRVPNPERKRHRYDERVNREGKLYTHKPEKAA